MVLALAAGWQIQEHNSAEPGIVVVNGGAGVDVAPTPTVQPSELQWAALESRPLVMPPLSEDGACPVSALRPLNEGEVLGRGPVSPVWGPVMQHQPTGNAEGGWYYWKTLWIATRDYEGAVLLRGAQLDGSNEIRFESGPERDRLRIPAGETGVGT
jgi:hypothetical protein